jgi:Helix-turn-helix domain
VDRVVGVTDPLRVAVEAEVAPGDEGRTPGAADTRSEIRELLTSRRVRITPEQAGLARYGENRRVPELRREAVALLAGVSVDYYTRLEDGRQSRPDDRRSESF